MVLVAFLVHCTKLITSNTQLRLPACYVQFKSDSVVNAELQKCLSVKPCLGWKDIGPKTGKARYCQSFFREEPSPMAIHLDETHDCRIEVAVNFESKSGSYTIIGRRLNRQHKRVNDMKLQTTSLGEGMIDDEFKNNFTVKTCHEVVDFALSMYDKNTE